ncbi:MAG: hypothetical protein IKS83_08305, partial [Victivallales bacterium]|nr:hypothetical protein [Victivallales bacterium]
RGFEPHLAPFFADMEARLRVYPFFLPGKRSFRQNIFAPPAPKHVAAGRFPVSISFPPHISIRCFSRHSRLLFFDPELFYGLSGDVKSQNRSKRL